MYIKTTAIDRPVTVAVAPVVLVVPVVVAVVLMPMNKWSLSLCRVVTLRNSMRPWYDPGTFPFDFVLFVFRWSITLFCCLVVYRRLQHHVHMSYPAIEDTQALLTYFFRNSPVETTVDWSAIATLIHQRCRTTAYIEKHLSVTRLLALRDEVITTVINDYLASHPHIATELQRISDVMLSGESCDVSDELVTAADVAHVTIRLDHLTQVVNQYFPEEKSLFTSPFGGTFTFNMGSSMY